MAELVDAFLEGRDITPTTRAADLGTDERRWAKAMGKGVTRLSDSKIRGDAQSEPEWYICLMDTSLAADRVRAALRDAGCQEWESGRRGFQVEGDPNGGWVVVACVHAVRHHKGHNGELQRYRDILSAAGFNVTESPHVPDVLRVTLPPDAAEV